MLIGTPYYMSPEQARGDDDLDARTDIYSLGIVLYELLTGSVPYRGMTPYSILSQQISAELPPPSVMNPNIPPSVEAVLLKALAKDRDARYDSAGELFSALREALGEPGSVVMPPPPARSRCAKASSSPAATPRKRIRQRRLPRRHLSRATYFPHPKRPSWATRLPAAEPTTARRRRRIGGLMWWLGAAVALILIVMLALGAIGRACRAAEAATQTSVADATATYIPTLAVTAAAQDSNIGAGLDLLAIPEMSVSDAQAYLRNNTDDPVAHLALFSAQLVSGDTNDLGDTLRDGIAYADNLAIYLLSAAAEAEKLGSDAITLVILRDGLTSLANDASYPVFREAAGRWLYDAATDSARVDLFGVSNLREIAQTADLTVAPIYLAMEARALLTLNRTRLAQTAVTAALQRSTELAEALLVQGEVRAAEGRPNDAQALWQAAANADGAPEWVSNRATALLAG